MKRALALTLLAGFALAGCSEDATISPAPAATTTSTSTATAPSDAGPPPSATVVNSAAAVRQVLTRNPFGGHPGNNLVDGDFELSTVRGTGHQTGWRAFSSSGTAETEIKTETGGLCHSGLRCAVMESGSLFLLHGAAAEGKGNLASIVAKVPEGKTCAVVKPQAIDCNGTTVLKNLHAEPTDNKPAADGWCHYWAEIPPQTSSICVYIESALAAGQVALVDEAQLGADDGTVVKIESAHVGSASDEAPVTSAETRARLAAIRALIRSTMPFGRRPDPPKPSP